MAFFNRDPGLRRGFPIFRFFGVCLVVVALDLFFCFFCFHRHLLPDSYRATHAAPHQAPIVPATTPVLQLEINVLGAFDPGVTALGFCPLGGVLYLSGPLFTHRETDIKSRKKHNEKGIIAPGGRVGVGGAATLAAAVTAAAAVVDGAGGRALRGMCSARSKGGLAGFFRWKKSPQNATAFDATSPVSKTPNLTPVVRKETMVDPPTSRDLKYQCISETPAYKGWRSIVKRKIRGPQGKVRTYDVITQEHTSVLVFTWDTQTNTTTILKEFYPGLNRLMYGVVGGNYEPDKHTSALQAAACELEEEAHLHEGTWHPLMKNGETVAGAGKYSTQIFHPYLVVDPVVKGEPRALDDGEFIEYIRGVSLEEVRAMIFAGDMSVTSGYATLMAIEKLRELGHIM